MPANDSWANAVVIVGSSGSTSGSNVDATSQVGEPLPTAGPGDGPWQTVWWKWVAPADMGVRFSTAGSRLLDTSGMDTTLGIYTGASLGTLFEVASNDDADSLSGDDSACSIAMFPATSGTTYYIQVGGYGDSDVGDLALAWDAHEQPVAPTITAPTGGTTVTVEDGDGDAVTVTWTPSAGVDYWQAAVTLTAWGEPDYIAETFDSGTTEMTTDLPVAYVTGDRYVWVRTLDDDGDSGEWSRWAGPVLIHVAVAVDAPLDCFEDEALADTPDLLWLFREGSGPQVEDLSGNGHHGVMSSVFEIAQDATTPAWDVYAYHELFLYGDFVDLDYPVGDSNEVDTFILLIAAQSESSGDPLSVTLGGDWTIIEQVHTTHVTFPTYTLIVAVSHADPPSLGFTIAGNISDAHRLTYGIIRPTGRLNGLTVYDSQSAVDETLDALLTPPLLSRPSPGGFYMLAVGAGYAGTTPFLLGPEPDVYVPDDWWGSYLGSSYPYPGLKAWAEAAGSNTEQPSLAISTGSAPAMMVTVALEYGDPTFDVTWGDTNICDDDCADTNGSIIFPNADPVNSAIIKAPTDYFPFIGDAWTLELVAGIGPVQAGQHSRGGTDAGILYTYLNAIWNSPDGVTAGGLTEPTTGADRLRVIGYSPPRNNCFNHVMLVVDASRSQPNDRVILYINGVRQSDPGHEYDYFSHRGGDFFYQSLSALGANGAALSAVAMYPTALPRRRVLAHFSHFCQMCHGARWAVSDATVSSSMRTNVDVRVRHGLREGRR